MRSVVPEVWGGIESTRNRVGDRYLDQLDLNGHAMRADDLRLIADLGITAIRYPVLWEHVAPNGVEQADWRWADERLALIRELGMRPIVGLVHHGSGPPHTDLTQRSFAEGVSAFARAVAERYPWVDAYTPVNEPLTTARFSGLYGHWYPHASDDRPFLRCLVEQCRAVVLAMQEIRKVRPDAELIQTEDIGKVYGPPVLGYQVDLENERRWLSYDLLFGRLVPGHPLYGFVVEQGIGPDELEWFADDARPPDIVGVNHYLSSERVIDVDVDAYPGETVGGNGRHRYIDVVAGRVLEEGPGGAAMELREAWERYGAPMAVTEAHNGSTREEQLRWLDEVWRSAASLRADSVDLRAVTVWSLLGATGWDLLVTGSSEWYEPGAFDVRSGTPRPTALATATRELATVGRISHPTVRGRGWWRRPDGLWFGRRARGARATTRPPTQPVLILGAGGTLGRGIVAAAATRGLDVVALSHAGLDACDAVAVDRAMERFRPWSVVNAAGFVRVDDAETEVAACARANAIGPRLVAVATAARRIPLAWFSTDLVFDGAKGAPYVENDDVAPLNVYGHTKFEGEIAVADAHPGALIVRTSAFFGVDDEANFVTQAVRTLRDGGTVRAPSDTVVTPTFVPDLAHAVLDLLIDEAGGLWHLTNGEPVTWFDLARRAAARCDIDPAALEACAFEDLGLAAARPRSSALGSDHGLQLPPLEDALERYAIGTSAPAEDVAA